MRSDLTSDSGRLTAMIPVKKRFLILAMLASVFTGCAGSAKFVGYEKPQIPATDLATINFENLSPFETRLWTFLDPLVCNEPVVNTVEKGFADDRVRQNERLVRHGERGRPFSFYIGIFSGSNTQWREVRQIVTFVPGDFDYEVLIGAAGSDGRLKSGGFAITEISQDGLRVLDSSDYVVREWRPASIGRTGWADPMTPSQLAKLGL